MPVLWTASGIGLERCLARGTRGLTTKITKFTNRPEIVVPHAPFGEGRAERCERALKLAESIL